MRSDDRVRLMYCVEKAGAVVVAAAVVSASQFDADSETVTRKMRCDKSDDLFLGEHEEQEQGQAKAQQALSRAKQYPD
jgi:hypothetical protein